MCASETNGNTRASPKETGFGPRSAFPWQLSRRSARRQTGPGFPLTPSFNQTGPPHSPANPSTPRHSAPTQKPHTGTRADAQLSTRSTRCGFISVFSRRSKAVAVCFAGLSPPDSSLPGTADLLSCHQHHNTHAAVHKHKLFLSLLSNSTQRTRNAHAVIATIGLKYLFVEAHAHLYICV